MSGADLSDALSDMWRSVLLFVPAALAFLAILIIGYLLARLIRYGSVVAGWRLGRVPVRGGGEGVGVGARPCRALARCSRLPLREGVGPLLRATQIEDLVARVDHAAVDVTDDER